jgi:signal transduction histidine kinase/CheY-like chemotaxis protein
VIGGRLFTKYVVLIAGLVTLALAVSGSLGFYLFSRENRLQLIALQQEKALGAAARIELYIKDIEHQMGWTALSPTQSGGQALEQRKLEYLKLLRQAPAITEVTWLDGSGKERLRISRIVMDRVDAHADHADRPYYREVGPGKHYYSDVYFRKETEPYVTIARPAGGASGGVIVAEVNLKFVWDVITQIKVGRLGLAFVVDSNGTLIAHPDINLVLQKTSLNRLSHVVAASQSQRMAEAGEAHFVRNLEGQEVLSAHAPVTGLRWNVFVELPRSEAFEPLVAFIYRGVLVLLAGVAVSVAASIVLARRMVRPIRALQAGAQGIGAGQLDQRIDVRTGDEIEALANQFNTMAEQLGESYATLEQKVAQRTQAAESANLAKSRFLAAASHDLRQPMHALNLYLGALANLDLPASGSRYVANLRQCAQSLDDLLDGLLDISKLDANAVEPDVEVFPLAPVFNRLRIQFAPQALAKGLELRVMASTAFARSDVALLERILRNLVSNAVRYTVCGKILVGCHRMRGKLRIAVYDTGPGIALEHQQLVFEEFYQIGNPERDRAKGLGLGLSIVQRLAKLLGAPILLVSQLHRGSMFAIDLPLAEEAEERIDALVSRPAVSLQDARIVVVDDEAAVLEASKALLEQWGCQVVVAASGFQAVQCLAGSSRPPDVLICDYRLREGESGLDVVERLRDEFNRHIPALIVTGDVVPESLQKLPAGDLKVLHKPVPERVLREAIEAMLAAGHSAASPEPAEVSPSR